MREWIKASLVNYLPARLAAQGAPGRQVRAEYVEWLSGDLTDIVCRFYLDQGLAADPFVRGVGELFETRRFELFVKKWLAEYLFGLFGALDGRAAGSAPPLRLEDNPLHRTALAEYGRRFGAVPAVLWEPPGALPARLGNGLALLGGVAWLSLRYGLRLAPARRGCQVLREAVWGLHGRGEHFHDDFLVDGRTIRAENLLLFSREGALGCAELAKAREEARRSPYAHFDLPGLKMGLGTLVSRVLPKYVLGGVRLLLGRALSPQFSLFSSLWSSFVANALPYERLFSNYAATSELGHHYFSAGHIPESIVCENHGAGYYAAHWSDHSVDADRFLAAFLGCDGYFVWGRAHLHGFEGAPSKTLPIGYYFKGRIQAIRRDPGERRRLLAAMGAAAAGKVVGAFDETFGGEIKMTEDHFIAFWAAVRDLAKAEPDACLVFKPKGDFFHDRFTDEGRRRFAPIRAEVEALANVLILDPERWSFIEAIGVCDLVLTQGMTSSSTIALVCGLDALYLDQAQYRHPFAAAFKDRIVFDDPARFVAQARALLHGAAQRPLEIIPEALLREYDAYPDDDGIARLRERLVSPRRGPAAPSGRVGIIVQARMGSTRLPGKVLLPLADRPMLAFLLERLRRSRRAHEIVVATTVNAQDDPVAELAAGEGAACFRGDEDDVLGRYQGAAKSRGLDVVVRVTADCPLMDPELVDEMIAEFLGRRDGLDYISNTLVRTFPRGLDVEVFSAAALDWAHRFADKPYQREHVTPYLYQYGLTDQFLRAEDASAFRVTVDTAADLDVVRRVVAAAPGQSLGHRALAALLRSRPDIAELNREVRQKALA
jgi:spore coat polysaccharide biosynthesis protein SpsF